MVNNYGQSPSGLYMGVTNKLANILGGGFNHFLFYLTSIFWKWVGSTTKQYFITVPSLKLTWHLKMDGWNTCFLLGPSLFSGAFAVSFRECTPLKFNMEP